MNTNYTKLSARKLRAEFARQSKAWRSLQKKESFSGLGISGRLERIQQELERRGLPFEPLYMEINIEVG